MVCGGRYADFHSTGESITRSGQGSVYIMELHNIEHILFGFEFSCSFYVPFAVWACTIIMCLAPLRLQFFELSEFVLLSLHHPCDCKTIWFAHTRSCLVTDVLAPLCLQFFELSESVLKRVKQRRRPLKSRTCDSIVANQGINNGKWPQQHREFVVFLVEVDV